MVYLVDCFEDSGSLVEFVVNAQNADEAQLLAKERYSELQRREQELIAIESMRITARRAKALVVQGRANDINVRYV